MILQKNKKGKIGMNFVNTVVLTIILITVLFQVYAEVIPEAQTGGDLMNDATRCAGSGCSWNTTNEICYATTNYSAATCSAGSQTIPLSGLVISGGVVFTIIMAALLVLVLKASMSAK